jgi:gliding motility-associated-like protein
MNKLFLSFINTCLSVTLSAQINLVPNGNFEDSVKCFENAAVRTSAIADWFIPINEVINPDSLCPYLAWWRFLKSRKMGLNNTKCGFIETYYRGFPDDNIYSGRGYLAIKLRKPLMANQQYYFEMYTRAVDTFPTLQLVNTLFTNGQEVAFTKDFPKFDIDLSRNFLNLNAIFPSKLHNDYEWRKINGCFKAQGGEKYMIIGNFSKNDDTKTLTTGKKNNNFPNGLTAYYAVDNVLLTPMTIDLRDTAVCLGDTLKLNVQRNLPDSLSYKWHTGQTTPQYQSTKSENITIEIKYPNNCVVNESITFKVLTPDYQPIAFDTLVCAGTSLTFKAGAGLKGETISWQNGTKERFFTTNTEGVFTAKIKNRCAQWTDSFRLKTRDCGNGVYVPNTFSPNNDGTNDVFKPFLKSDFYPILTYKFSVFNRWGSLIFQTNDKEMGWNGTYKNQELPNDVYIWVVDIQYNDKDKIKNFLLNGDITLIR